MPIYEYKCGHCSHQFEILQKIGNEPAKTCPECGEDTLRKMVSAAAFKLKGTGWYETDFKDKKSKIDKKADTNEKGDSAQKKDTDNHAKKDGTVKSAESEKSSKKKTDNK